MRPLSLTLTALSLALSGLVRAEEAQPQPRPEPSWKVYTSQEGHFSVRFPVAPKEETRKSGNGAAIRFLSAQVPGLAYSVNYTDLPEEVQNIPAGNVIDNVRNGLVRRTRGRLVEDRYVEIKPHQGRQLRIETPDKSTTLVRVYLVKNRLYQLRVLALPQQQLAPESTVRFFDSFKLSPPPADGAPART